MSMHIAESIEQIERRLHGSGVCMEAGIPAGFGPSFILYSGDNQ